MSTRNLLNVFQYWGQGFNAMPLFIKIIYKHNLEFCKKNNINLILIDDNNVNNYITPHLRFKTLDYNFSDLYPHLMDCEKEHSIDKNIKESTETSNHSGFRN